MGTIGNLILNLLFIIAGGFGLWVLVSETKKTITMLRKPNHDR